MNHDLITLLQHMACGLVFCDEDHEGHSPRRASVFAEIGRLLSLDEPIMAPAEPRMADKDGYAMPCPICNGTGRVPYGKKLFCSPKEMDWDCRACPLKPKKEDHAKEIALLEAWCNFPTKIEKVREIIKILKARDE